MMAKLKFMAPLLMAGMAATAIAAAPYAVADAYAVAAGRFITPLFPPHPGGEFDHPLCPPRSGRRRMLQWHLRWRRCERRQRLHRRWNVRFRWPPRR